MTRLVQKLSKGEAIREVPRVVLGIIRGSVSIFLPNTTQSTSSAEVTFADGSIIALHPDDYAFIQEDLVPFFFDRNMSVSEETVCGYIASTWPDVTLGPVVPGPASELLDSEPLEIP